MGNPFSAPNLGDDNGGIGDVLKRQFVQKSDPTAAAAKQSDPTLDIMTPEAVSERRTAAAKMRDGLNSAFGTRDAVGNISLRGTDVQNQATTTASAQKAAPDTGSTGKDPDVIPPPSDPDAPYQTPSDDAEKQANDRYENNKRYRDRTGKGGDSIIPGGN